MNCKIARGSYGDYAGDAIIAFMFKGENNIKGPLGKTINNAVKAGHFNGDSQDLFQIYPCADIRCQRVILVGLGKKDKSTSENIRKAAGAAIRKLQSLKKAAVLPPGNSGETIPWIIEGAVLGNYRFDTLKNDPKNINLKELLFYSNDAGLSQNILDHARIPAEGNLVARELTNLPGNLLTPAILSRKAADLGKKYKIPVKILNEPELKKLKMGALLGVGQGSVNRPKMVVWEYKGSKAKDAPIVFVGKGVTFDSGGISIKAAAGMEAMKGDMGGAAAVISLITVLGQLKPKINVIGITPLVENLPSGTAYRPGDVLTASNGKTIEVISTDAEGRLILADALAYAGKYNPKYLIDIATLTGACMVALGVHICAGIMGTDQKLIDSLIKAGENSGERLWQLPLWDDYNSLLDSPSADMKNSGGRWGGAITAGAFLSNFTEDLDWAHIDIAGMDNEEGSHPYRSKGGTGWGVRLLTRFVLSQAPPKSP